MPPLLIGKSSEIRGSFLYKILGKLIGCALWIIGSTWQYRLLIKDRSCLDSPSIFCFWHNRILAAPSAWQNLSTDVKMGFLTSASKDGTLVTQALSLFNHVGARGSSHRRGVGALMKLHGMLKQGMSLAMTPDGPRGPIYTVKEGILRIAKVSGVPVIPIAIHFESTWRLKKTWDGFCFPKPFSKIVVKFGEPILIPEDVADDALEPYGEALEKSMKWGSPDFEPLDPQY